MYGNSVEAFQRAQAIPRVGPAPEPEAPSTTAGGLWRAVRNAVPAIAAETSAAVVKLGTMALEGSSAAGGRTEQIGQELERSLRNVAESYAPDPMTASKAEQVVFGLTRGVGKAVGYGLTTGPLAPLGFGIDEGLTEREKLLRQGVDEATAGKVGALAGVVNAAGFAIPAAGSTVAKTIGLATLSGPASFIAQQAGSREILRAADYESIASSYDPTDALGLALSAIPFGFGAWAMRGRFKTGKPAPEAKPAVVNESLTTQPAPDAIPVEPMRAADETGAVIPLEQSPDTVRTTPDIGEGSPDIAARSPDVVPEPIVRQEHVDAAMVKNLMDASEMESPPMESLEAFAARTIPPEAPTPKAGKDPFLAWLKEMIRRAMAGDSIKPLETIYGDIEAQYRLEADALMAEELSRRLEILGVDPAPARGNVDVLSAYLEQHEPRLLRQRLAEVGTVDEYDLPTPTPKETPADVPSPAKLGEETREAPAAQREAQAGDIPAGTGPEAATVAVFKSEAERILETNPDMVVDVDAQGNKITAREAMEKIRREAAEGTADELGADDAKLVKVAAECALSFGE